MAEAAGGKSDDRSLDRYLALQAHNLSEIRQLPEFAFVERVHELYERSLAVKPRDPDLRFTQLLIICHGALLSAAATIGRALPGDSVSVTRRAIEAARLAAAVKADPKNFERWLDYEARLARWKDRDRGIKPKGGVGSRVAYPSSVDRLRKQLSILSDVGVHFTPEYASTQPIRTEPSVERPGSGTAHISYFEAQEAIERGLMVLGSVHLEILEVFVGVFDGVFHRDEEWMRQRAETARVGKSLAGRFKAEAEGDDEEEQKG